MTIEFKTDFSDAKLFRAMQDFIGGGSGGGGGGVATGASGGQGELMQAVSRQTLYFIGKAQREQMSGRSGTRYLNVDTGNLRRSWFSKTSIQNGVLKTEAYTNVKYAAIHQYGGVINRQARQAVLSFGKSGRFVSPSKKGFQSKATGQRQQKVSVGSYMIRIPKRLYIVEAFEKEMPDRYRKAIAEAIRKVIHG